MQRSTHSTTPSTSQSARLRSIPVLLILLALVASVATTALAASGRTVVSPSGTAQNGKSAMIAAGTPYATPYYVNDSGVPGPTVMVVGGMHGNEPAGYLAAQQLSKTVPQRGKLVVIPELNRLGVEDHARSGRHPGDPNRDYPRSRNERPDTTLARNVWSLVKEVQPDYLLDLHEGYDFHKLNSKSVGQSIIYYPKGDTYKMANGMREAVNNKISKSSHRFSLLKYPIKGSLARAAGLATHSKTMILETSKKEPLNTRVSQHLAMVNTALERLDMK